jgi:hypothetical protein
MLVYNEPAVVTKDFHYVNSTGNLIYPIVILITTYLKCIHIFLRYWVDYLIIRLSVFDLVIQMSLAASMSVQNIFLIISFINFIE